MTPPPKKGDVRQKLWQAMRIMKRFTIPQLMATASADAGATRRYVNALQNADYLRVLRRHGNQPGDYAVYQLLRNTGPQHPTTTNAQVVYDPNRDSYHLPRQMMERIDAKLADCTARCG